jgi:hypothetical protein
VAFDDKSAENSLDTYYNRQQDVANQALAKKMAARGLAGSGFATRAAGEQGAALAANKSKDWLALMGQADQAEMARTAQAGQWKQAEAADLGNRVQTRLQGSRAADQSSIDAARALQTGAATAAQIDKLVADGLLDVDEARRARLVAGGQEARANATTKANVFGQGQQAMTNYFNVAEDISPEGLYFNRYNQTAGADATQQGMKNNRISTTQSILSGVTGQGAQTVISGIASLAGADSENFNALINSELALGGAAATAAAQRLAAIQGMTDSAQKAAAAYAYYQELEAKKKSPSGGLKENPF